jgi:hypothetical protein
MRISSLLSTTNKILFESKSIQYRTNLTSTFHKHWANTRVGWQRVQLVWACNTTLQYLHCSWALQSVQLIHMICWCISKHRKSLWCWIPISVAESASHIRWNRWRIFPRWYQWGRGESNLIWGRRVHISHFLLSSDSWKRSIHRWVHSKCCRLHPYSLWNQLSQSLADGDPVQFCGTSERRIQEVCND